MPFLTVDDARLHYQTDGDPRHPCLVLCHSLGTDLGMWETQAAALASRFFVLRHDARGHGLSKHDGGPVGIERLGRDLIALLDALGIGSTHFCGISMGGLTGQWLGIHAPGRIGKLVLANTAARIGSPDGWRERAAHVRKEGMHGVADGAAGRWFTAEFIRRHPAVVEGMVACLRKQDPHAYAACCEALAHADLRETVTAIANPTLVIAGRHDPVTTEADAEWLTRRIAPASMAVLDASHLSSVEAGGEFTRIVQRFLAD